jgi:hypothetical protein
MTNQSGVCKNYGRCQHRRRFNTEANEVFIAGTEAVSRRR